MHVPCSRPGPAPASSPSPLCTPRQDVDFHPSEPLIATGLIDGKLLLHSYSAEAVAQREAMKAHSASCRAVRFLLSGELLISASADQSLLAVDVETGKPAARKKAAHDNAINRLAAVGQTVTASGARGGAGCVASGTYVGSSFGMVSGWPGCLTVGWLQGTRWGARPVLKGLTRPDQPPCSAIPARPVAPPARRR